MGLALLLGAPGCWIGFEPLEREPDQVAGLALWLDADDEASFQLDGSTVVRWSDRSGSGNHGTVEVPGKEPVRELDALDGQPGVVFTADFLKVRGLDVRLENNPDITSFAVFMPNETDFQEIWVGVLNGFLDERRHLEPLHWNIGTIQLATLGWQVAERDPEDCPGLPVEVKYRWADGADSPDISCVDTPSFGSDVGIGFGQLLFASPDYEGAYNCNYTLGEVLVYTRTLSETERRGIRSYLTEKWSLPY